MRLVLLVLACFGCRKTQPESIASMVLDAVPAPKSEELPASKNVLTFRFIEPKWFIGAPPGFPILLGKWETETAIHAPVRILKRRLQVYISDKPFALGSFHERTRDLTVTDCITTCYLILDGEHILAQALPDENGILTFETPFMIEPDAADHSLVCDSRSGIPPQTRLGFTAAEVETASLEENIVAEDTQHRHVPVELGLQNMDGNVPRILTVIHGVGYSDIVMVPMD